MFKGIRSGLTNFFHKPKTLPPAGLYHYVREGQGERARLHLRVDPDGSGLLMINANRILHLNPTAASIAYLALEDKPPEEAAVALRQAYNVKISQALDDYTKTAAQINELSRPGAGCPFCELDGSPADLLAVAAPFSARPSAPYRMDLALTYRCNNDCSHCYNARPRDFKEISTAQWKEILDRLWEIGIPHIVFTGGEPTLRADLPELIAYAESKGQITGVNTNGRRLGGRAYLDELVSAGLDHVQITLESHDAEIHDAMVASRGAWKQTVQGIKNSLDSSLYVMTNTTMLQPNAALLAETLDFTAQLGVPTIGLNALIYSGRGLKISNMVDEKDLPPLLEMARQKTAEHNQRLIWYTPTQYCNFDPMQLELGVKGCTAALYNMCVEPDGGVIPCQSYYQQLGNLLTIQWEDIWNHSLATSLRERRYIPEKCHGCALLSECGGGCPLRLEAQTASKRE